VYGEVLQRIQNDYVDEPNMHLVTAGSLHGLLESLDSESEFAVLLVFRDSQNGSNSIPNPTTPATRAAIPRHQCMFGSST